MSIMKVSRVRKQIDERIKQDAHYAVFIKPDDAESDCLINFIKRNGINAVIIDIGTPAGFQYTFDYNILECDVPCICSTETYEELYEGCPKSIEELRLCIHDWK